MKNGELRVGIVIGLVVGLLLGLGGGSYAMYRFQRSGVERARERWVLRPVIVFNRALEAGAAVDYDDVAKMQIPEQFVTGSHVPPRDFERVVGLKLRYPVERGDLVFYSQFGPAPPNEPARAP